MAEIKLARRLDKTVVGWIVKVDINGRRRGRFFKHRRAAEFYLKFHTLERLDSFIAASGGKRLTYKELTA